MDRTYHNTDNYSKKNSPSSIRPICLFNEYVSESENPHIKLFGIANTNIRSQIGTTQKKNYVISKQINWSIRSYHVLGLFTGYPPHLNCTIRKMMAKC